MIIKKSKPLRLICFTDPICSTCWAYSPYLRKLEVEYGHLFSFEYKMGGLLESWENFKDPTGKIKHPKDLVYYWNKLGKESGMGIDGKIWIDNPLKSSFPPSLAYHAVKILKPEKSHQYLRLMRELLFLKNIDITNLGTLAQLAETIGIEQKRFLKEISSDENIERFMSDLREKAENAINALPTFILINKENEQVVIKHNESYSSFEIAIKRLLNIEVEKSECNFSAYEMLKHFGLLSTHEIAVLLNTYFDEIEAELNELEYNNFVFSETYKYSKFWRANERIIPKTLPKNEHFKVAIVGGGIAGLSAAIYFKNKSINVKVFERYSEMTSRGLGFLIMSNGYEMIKKMDLEQEFCSYSNRIDKIKMMKTNGKLVEHKVIENCYAISRYHCIKMLSEKLDNDDIVYNKEIVDFHKNEFNRIDSILFSDGTIESPNLIIASDGVNSKFRKTLFPQINGSYVAEKEIVSSVNLPELSEELGDTFLKILAPEIGFNIGILSSGWGNIIWFIQINTLKIKEPENTPEALRLFSMEIAQKIPDKYLQIFEKTDYTGSYLWKTYDMDILPSFHKNGIMLLGDSAHPLLSFTSQGASSALEDSYLLSQLLEDKSRFSNTSELYERFYQIRKPIINECIRGGRVLLEQFLYPEKYKKIDLPFVSYATK